MEPPPLMDALTSAAKPRGRRAWLVKQEISLWRLGIVVCVLLVLIWVGWRIIAQTAAQSLARSHPDAALSWVTDQPFALNQLRAKGIGRARWQSRFCARMGAACSALKPAECPSLDLARLDC